MFTIVYAAEKAKETTEELAKASEVNWDGILSGIKSVIGSISAIASAGPVGWIVTGVLAVVGIGGFFLAKCLIQRWYAKQVHKETVKQRVKDQAATAGKDQKLSKKWRDARTKMDSIRERMKKKREEAGE